MPGSDSLDLKFSHIGLYVTDLPRMVDFYRGALRFTQTDTGGLGSVQLAFLSRDPAEHHQIVLATGRPADLAFNVVNQVSFRVPDLPTLRRFHQRLLAHGATDVQPVTHGNAISVYCRDPEGNRLELFVDTPWYCEQPLREPVDFAESDEAIMQRTESIASRLPGFRSRDEWQAEVARRMAEDQRG
jgi:catechol 2,3-dioxygenase-like lactoylglutathione lyase family enzyme